MEVIGRLMDREYPYGGQEDSRLGKEAASISTALSAKLDEGGKSSWRNFVILKFSVPYWYRRTPLKSASVPEFGSCVKS